MYRARRAFPRDKWHAKGGSPALHFWAFLDALVAGVWKAYTMICVPVGPRFQEDANPFNCTPESLMEQFNAS